MKSIPRKMIALLGRENEKKIDLIANDIKCRFGYRKFPDRIYFRDKMDKFYTNRSELELRVMSASDPLEKWKDVENWRYKLDDKYNAREFVKKFGCSLPELYYHGNDVEEIDFNSLPKDFVVKPNRASSARGVYVIRNGINAFDGITYDHSRLKEELKSYLSKNPHKNIMIEEYVLDERNDKTIPDDYKVFTFNGHIACVQLIQRFSKQEVYFNFYDEQWNELPPIKLEAKVGKPQSAPACLPQILEQAKTLSKAYGIFVRLDFYATKKGAVFGEFTPTPAKYTKWSDYGVKLLTSYWDRYCKGTI